MLIVGVSIQTYIPYTIGQILDLCTKAEEYEKLGNYSIVFIGLFMSLGLSTMIRIYSTNFLTEQVSYTLRKEAFSKFVNYDITFFEQNKVGDLISRLTSDVNVAKTAAGENIFTFARNLFLCAGNVGMLFFISWRTTLAVIPIIPIYYGISSYFSKKFKEY